MPGPLCTRKLLFEGIRGLLPRRFGRSSTPLLRRPRGFSLAELLLALALWSSAFLSIFALYTTCHGTIVRSNNIMNASNIALTQIESLKFANYDNIASTPETAVTLTSYYGNQQIRLTYLYTTTVTPDVTPATSSNLKDIQVQVIWQEPGFNATSHSAWKSISMETVIAR